MGSIVNVILHFKRLNIKEIGFMEISYFIMLSIMSLTFFVIGLYLYKKENKIKLNASTKTTGIVSKYKYSYIIKEIVIVVTYEVDDTKYKNILTYSQLPIQSHLEKKKTTEQNNINNDHLSDDAKKVYSVGSEINVYYDPNNPKISYIERYIPSRFPLLFIFISILMIVFTIISYILTLC